MVQVGLEGCELQMQPKLPMPVVSCHLALDSTQPCVCAVQLCHPSLWCCHLSVSLLDMPQNRWIHCCCLPAGEPWVTDTAAFMLSHIAMHRQLHHALADAIPVMVQALSKEIDTEEQMVGPN